MNTTISRSAILSLLLLLTLSVSAQRRVKTDSLRVTCFLQQATEVQAGPDAIDLGTKEIRLLLTSRTDTVVRAGTTGKVTTLSRADDGTWEIVFHHDDYYFWISGIREPKVRRQQGVKPDDPIGLINPGDRVEIRLYDFETPVDVKQFMNCPR